MFLIVYFGSVGSVKEADIIFLAPIGAQEMLILVCALVCLCGLNLSRAVNFHHSGSNLQAISQD